MPGFLLLLLALFHSVALNAEPLHLSQLQHKTWTVSDGAPSHIYDIAQGKDGRLWLSTTYGIYTFNGVSYSAFEPPRGSVMHYAYALTVARNGAVWGSSYLEGVIRIEGGRLTTYGPEQGLPHGGIDTLAEGPDGTMWAVGDGGLFQLRDGHWYAEPGDSRLPGGQAVKVFFDRQRVQWVVTKNSLYFRQPGHLKFEPTGQAWSNDSFVCTLVESPAGGLWIVLDRINAEKAVVRQLNVPGHSTGSPQQFEFPFEVQDAKFDRAGSLWISGHGLGRIAFQPDAAGSPAVTAHVEELDPAQGFSSAETRSLLPDADGDLWVTTLRGLERFREPVLIKLSGRVIDSSTRPDLAGGAAGRVWIGTGNAPLLRVDGSGSTEIGPALDSFFCLFEDRDGAVWFNSRKGLWRAQGGRMSSIPVPPGVFFQDLRQVIQMPDGTMLFSFRQKGVWRWSAEQWTRLSPAEIGPEQPGVMFVDSHGVLWGGFLSGRISRLNDVRTTEASSYRSTLGGIYGFLELSQGVLVSGENGVGLLRNGQIVPLSFADGLQATGVSGMVQSLDGDLWLNGTHGILHVARAELDACLSAPQSHQLRAELITEPDVRGPAPFLYDMPTAARDGAGHLWFNTSDTIAYLDPSRMHGSMTLPNLALSSVEADGKSLDPGSLRAPAGSHTLRLAYFGTYLAEPEKVHYKYKLDGVDDSWQDVGKRTEAVYTRLRPGSYLFHVIASSNGENWTAPVSARFDVVPTFYQTNWFLGLCAALVVGFAALLYHLRIRSLTSRMRERADARMNERLSIARDLHDTLLQGVHGLILSFHVGIQKIPVESNARAPLEGALALADRIMIEGRDRLSQLRTEGVEGRTLLQALRTLKQTLNQDGSVHFHVRATGEEAALQPLVADELFVIAREALTNAFHHADAQTIGVDLQFSPREFCLVCHDDGRGIQGKDVERASSARHYGMLGMQERARKIGARYSCWTEPHRGTRITLTLAGGRAYLRHGKLNAWLRKVRWSPQLPGR